MQYGSLQNMQAGNMLPKPGFQVGDGATVIMWSDRHACTIIDIRKNGREIVLQEDTATRIGKIEMSDSQSYTFTPDPDGKIWEATIRKDGTYKIKGSSMGVLVGHRSHYYDYSF